MVRNEANSARPAGQAHRAVVQTNPIWLRTGAGARRARRPNDAKQSQFPKASGFRIQQPDTRCPAPDPCAFVRNKPNSLEAIWRTSAVPIRTCEESHAGAASQKQSQSPAKSTGSGPAGGPCHRRGRLYKQTQLSRCRRGEGPVRTNKANSAAGPAAPNEPNRREQPADRASAVQTKPISRPVGGQLYEQSQFPGSAVGGSGAAVQTNPIGPVIRCCRRVLLV
jgi:hypothetical protein